MTTRGVLEDARDRLVGQRADAVWPVRSFLAEAIDRIDALIAHLDHVGWPEEPKICETCAFVTRLASRARMWSACRHTDMTCTKMGGGCLAWVKRDE